MQRVGGWSHTYPTSGVQHHAGYQRLVRQLLHFHVAFLVLFIAKRFLLFYKAVEAAAGGKGVSGCRENLWRIFPLFRLFRFFVGAHVLRYFVYFAADESLFVFGTVWLLV